MVMSVKLEQVVPFGRSLKEYKWMFNLSAADYQRQILDCSGGPASFNAEMTEQGYSVISIDPIYEFSGAQIKQQFLATVDDVITQIDATPQNWIWSFHYNSQDLRRNRTEALQRFLHDYEAGRATGRYRLAALPRLPFTTGEFDLVLCSHFLFLYSDLFSLQFHLESILELCRVGREIRIFPLLTLATEFSPYVKPVQTALAEAGWQSRVERVGYELQRGGNEMLKIWQE
jgi:hypothetical protein